MVETDIIETKKGAALGMKITLQKVPLFIIRAEHGYIGCGYFNTQAIKKAKDCAIIVKGVKSFKEMLKKPAFFVSDEAKKLGIKKGMRAEQALEKMQ